MINASKQHLNEVDEGYPEHLSAALGIAALLVRAGLGCAVHALIPALCTRTASRCVARVHAQMTARTATANANSRRAPLSTERITPDNDLTMPSGSIFSS